MGCAVVLTLPNRERTTAERISHLGFETWLPLINVTRAGRVCCEPLFPRYLFVWIVDAWRAVKNTVGVVDVLRNGEFPGFVPDHTPQRTGILDLRARERNGVIVLESKQRFVSGERVRVETGVMSGQTGLFWGMTGAERCRVLFDMMGQLAPVEVNEVALSAA